MKQTGTITRCARTSRIPALPLTCTDVKLGRDKRDAVDNMVANGTMHTTAATAWTLAAGYRPTSTQRIRAAVNVGNAISAGITTSRAVGITLTPAVNADVYFNAVVPLGTAG